MRRFLVVVALLSISLALFSQVHEDKNFCVIACDPEIVKENASLIYGKILNDSIRKELYNIGPTKFPLRFAIVSQEDFELTDSIKHLLEGVVTNLNYTFKNTKFDFYIDQITRVKSNLKLEDLSENSFNLYDTFSAENDTDNMITVYILDHKNDFCQITETSIRCGRVGGFSYILSSRTNNIVISQFDLRDAKIVAHEFGHFFGLYHTFEEGLFGKDNFKNEECNTTGDLICDTPPDPGTIFEIYASYATCEMQGLTAPNGKEYKPILQNIMSYYKPCYLKENSFTEQQELVMMLSSQLKIRKKLSR